MDVRMLPVAYRVGRIFVSEVYAFYQDTYKGVLGKVQVEALDYIHQRERVSVGELGRRLNISKQHASKIAGKLEERGYALKGPDPSDGRGSLYQLTEEGRGFLLSHIERSNAYLENALSSLDEGQQERLLQALEEAADLLEGCFGHPEQEGKE